MNTTNNWFTEECIECGTSFSLKINAKLHEEQTAFQKIEIYSTKNFGNLMVIDGYIMLTQRDNFIYHEMLAHPGLFAHPKPRNIVIIGGGDCGTLREVAKHACINQITQVEIDSAVTNLSQRYFPELCGANNDARVDMIFEDAIEWIKNATKTSIDLIIIDSTDPIGPAKGLFTTPFYQNCFRVLKNDGLIVQQSESPLIHIDTIIKPMHKCMREAGFLSTKLIHFPLPSYPSGWWSATLASKNNNIFFARETEAKQSTFITQYYNPGIHQACFAAPQFLSNI